MKLVTLFLLTLTLGFYSCGDKDKSNTHSHTVNRQTVPPQTPQQHIPRATPVNNHDIFSGCVGSTTNYFQGIPNSYVMEINDPITGYSYNYFYGYYMTFHQGQYYYFNQYGHCHHYPQWQIYVHDNNNTWMWEWERYYDFGYDFHFNFNFGFWLDL